MAHSVLFHRWTRGVSLVEALVALAVMSIGMLALVGVQSTMRLNSDLAKQRTEATRIASEEIERLRSFTSMGAVPGQPGISYDEIASRVVENYQPPEGIGNTSYRVQRTVIELAARAQKMVSVQVQWTDRTNQRQTVTIDSSISASAPTLGAMLLVPHRDSATSRNQGRHISIPDSSIDLGDGYSRFQPPGSSGVGWYFNNLTGVLRVCLSEVDNYATCPLATLVSGTVQYSLANTTPTDVSDYEVPQGRVFRLARGPHALELDNIAGNVDSYCFSTTLSTRVLYFCAMVSDAAGWGGQLNPVPIDEDGDSLDFRYLASDYKVCRFTTDVPAAENPSGVETVQKEEDLHAKYTLNADHPLKYCMERPPNDGEDGLACTGRRVKTNLINQNFLVIPGQLLCPTENADSPLDSLTQRFTNNQNQMLINTRQHLPVP